MDLDGMAPTDTIAKFNTSNGNPAIIQSDGGLVFFRGDSDTDTDGAGGSSLHDKTGQPHTNLKGGGADASGRRIFKNADRDDDVDPKNQSFTVIPGGNTYKNMVKEGVDFGDVAYSFNILTKGSTFSLVADKGPKNKLGENSILANEQLGIPKPSANNGEDRNVIITIIFPGSRLQFTSANSPFNTRGKIPKQNQIDDLGRNLYKSNAELIKKIIELLKNGQSYKKFD